MKSAFTPASNRCACCGGMIREPWRMGAFCMACVSAHVNRDCEARPGACDLCDTAQKEIYA